MLVLDPRRVVFDGEAWERVEAVTVDREARSALVAYGGTGPHAVLVDAPEQRVTVRVVSSVLEDDLGGPAVGSAGVLEFVAGAGPGIRRSRTVRVDLAVVTGVTYALSGGPVDSARSGSGRAGVGRGATRTVVLVGQSSDGAADPVTVTESE